MSFFFKKKKLPNTFIVIVPTNHSCMPQVKEALLQIFYCFDFHHSCKRVYSSVGQLLHSRQKLGSALIAKYEQSPNTQTKLSHGQTRFQQQYEHWTFVCSAGVVLRQRKLSMYATIRVIFMRIVNVIDTIKRNNNSEISYTS